MNGSTGGAFTHLEVFLAIPALRADKILKNIKIPKRRKNIELAKTSKFLGIDPGCYYVF